MKIQNLAAIILRLIALYFLYMSLLGLLRVYLLMSTGGSSAYESSFLLIGLEVIFPLIGFVCLWVFPNTVAQLIVKSSNSETIKPMATIDWLRIIIISMGLFITIRALFDATYWISAYQMMTDDDIKIFMIEQKASMITTVVEFIVGLLLITKNTWFSQTLLKINAPEVVSNKISNQDN